MANKSKAKEFVKKWQGRGDEKQDTSHFWLELLQEVYGDTEIHNDNHISFEVRADKQNKTGKDFKDVVINRRSRNATLIEQKSFDINLDNQNKQSDGSLLTPFEQASKYDNNSSVDDKARWIITCNFQEFRIYDMSKTGVDRYEPKVLKLDELPAKIDWLDFLLPNYSEENPQFIEETAVSVKAGELVGKMYDALLERYKDPTSERTQKELNKLCVRLVFCLYADDAGLFDKNDTNKFENYIKNTATNQVRRALKDLFEVLNQREGERDNYLDDNLKSFPYVNGGLFQGDVEIPNFDDELKKLLVDDESAAFDWSVVSPTIFGAVFESTLNAETRRNGGMHYTSIENIHKVIDPLFLDNLKKELNDALSYSISSKKEKALIEFQKKISNLTFMDPACGSGNFLTETYLSLRRLENEVIRQLQGIKVALDFENNSVTKVSIQQFFGIEINDFAVAVAKTALWIAESQMFKETESILSGNREYFPLHSFNNILEGNALSVDWEEVISKDKLSYIMGNPPFVGYSQQSKEQKADLALLTSHKNVDYVAGWYFKAVRFIKHTNIKCAFVSTNSIVQGEQVAIIWKDMFEKNKLTIDFAYRTFRWDSEALEKAQVHCVIIGFSVVTSQLDKKIFIEDSYIKASNINAYLMDAPNIWIERRFTPLFDVSPMNKGSQPTDDGNLIVTEEEYDDFIKKEPKAKEYLKLYLGSTEFLNGKKRYCLWFENVSPTIINEMPSVKKRIEKTQMFRLSSNKEATKKSAETSYLFQEIRQPKTDYLAIPVTTSENRKYIPIGYLTSEVICSNAILMIPDATLYEFGILNSIVHMAWMRAVTGRMKSDYQYSASIVYNNFIWPFSTPTQKEKIKQSAQAILDARALYPDTSLADLYDPLTMPVVLKKAHEANDKVVMDAYGFDKDMSDSEIVTKLFELYEKTITRKKV